RPCPRSGFRTPPSLAILATWPRNQTEDWLRSWTSLSFLMLGFGTNGVAWRCYENDRKRICKVKHQRMSRAVSAGRPAHQTGLTRPALDASLQIVKIYSVLVRLNNEPHA